MAETPMNWMFQLFDKISAPAKSASASLDGLRHSLFETLEITHRLGEGLAKIGEKAFDFGGEILKAAGKTEKTTFAFKTLLGSGEKAADLMERMERIAPHIGLQGSEAKDLGLSLLRSGMNQNAMRLAIPAAADIAAINPDNPGALNQAAELFGNIQKKGFGARALLGAAALDFNVESLTQQIADRMGTNIAGAKDLIEKGKVSAEVGLGAIYAELQKKTGGGPLGTAAVEASTHVTTLIHLLKGIPEDLFENLDKSAGFEVIRGALKNVVEMFDASSEGGKRLRSVIDTVFTKTVTALFGTLSGEQGGKRVEEFLIKLISILEKMPAIIDTTVTVIALWFDFFGALISRIIDGYSALIDLGGRFGDSLAAFKNDLMMFFTMSDRNFFDMAKDWGKALWEGFKDGVMFYANLGYDALEGVVQGILNRINGKLEIHSPSKVFDRMGRQVGAGLAQGISASRGDVVGAFGDMGIDAPSTSVRLPGGGLQPVSVSVGGIEIHIDGSDIRDAEGVAEALRAQLPGAIQSIFEQVAMQQGAI